MGTAYECQRASRRSAFAWSLGGLLVAEAAELGFELAGAAGFEVGAGFGLPAGLALVDAGLALVGEGGDGAAGLGVEPF